MIAKCPTWNRRAGWIEFSVNESRQDEVVFLPVAIWNSMAKQLWNYGFNIRFSTASFEANEVAAIVAIFIYSVFVSSAELCPTITRTVIELDS